MTAQTVTLIAAIIAASTSLCVLCVNLLAQYRGEMRAAYRKALEPHLGALGQYLYMTMACSKIVAAKGDQGGQSKENWRKRADEARKELGTLRLEVRYSLWGLDEPLRVITRLPNWIEHNKENREKTDALIQVATILREAIDNSIRRAYTQGRPISWWERRSLAKKAKFLREQYRSGAPEGFDEESEES